MVRDLVLSVARVLDGEHLMHFGIKCASARGSANWAARYDPY